MRSVGFQCNFLIPLEMGETDLGQTGDTMKIRKAETKDLSRIAEIFVFNNRINYLPIFKDESYSFGELQVVSFIEQYLKRKEVYQNLFVYDDGLIKGFLQMKGTEIYKLYIEPCFQREGIGHELIELKRETS